MHCLYVYSKVRDVKGSLHISVIAHRPGKFEVAHCCVVLVTVVQIMQRTILTVPR